jgi:hypothetical protein
MTTNRSLPILIGTFLLVSSALASWAQTTQERVHGDSHSVMPFDMSKTLHIFKMTERGGVESVVARNPDSTEQIALVRANLQHEASEFQIGHYSDPAALHGAAMPGLQELTQGASRIKVSYVDVPNGAAITFETDDVHMLTAIHKWFGAQLSEHGADARAE